MLLTVTPPRQHPCHLALLTATSLQPDSKQNQSVTLCASPNCPAMWCRYIDNMTSERVDAEGISNIAKAAKHFLPAQSFQPEVEEVLSMRSTGDLEAWERLDDTIMGGKSGSFLQTAQQLQGFQGDYDHKKLYQFEGSVWRGETITDGGGFCGARTKVLFSPLPLPPFVMHVALCQLVICLQPPPSHMWLCHIQWKLFLQVYKLCAFPDIVRSCLVYQQMHCSDNQHDSSVACLCMQSAVLSYAFCIPTAGSSVVPLYADAGPEIATL